MRRQPSSFQTMFSQVQEGRKKDPTLQNWATGVQKTQTGATQQATGQTTEKAKEVESKTGGETITTKMGEIAGATGASPSSVTTPTITTNWDTSKPAAPFYGGTDLGKWQEVLSTNYAAPVSQAANTAATDVLAQQRTGIQQAEEQQKAIEQGQTDYLRGLRDYLGADDHNLGATPQTSPLESTAAGITDVLSQPSTSNIAALQALLGASYDPRLAAIESGIYEGAVSQARGEATTAKTDLAQAEKARQKTLEDYLTGKQKAGTRVGEAEGKVGIDAATGKKFSDAVIENINKQTNDQLAKIKEESDALAQTYPTLAKEQFRSNVNTILDNTINVVNSAFTPEAMAAADAHLNSLEQNLPMFEKYAPDYVAKIRERLATHRAILAERRKDAEERAKKAEEKKKPKTTPTSTRPSGDWREQTRERPIEGGPSEQDKMDAGDGGYSIA